MVSHKLLKQKRSFWSIWATGQLAKYNSNLANNCGWKQYKQTAEYKRKFKKNG